MPRFSLFSICISSHYSPCLQQSFFSSNWKWFEVQLCVIQRKNEVPVVGQLVCHYWTLKNVHEDVHMQMCKCWWRKRDSHSMKPVVAAWPNSVVIHVIKQEENFHKVVAHDASKSSSLIHSFRSLSTNPSMASSKNFKSRVDRSRNVSREREIFLSRHLNLFSLVLIQKKKIIM